MSSRLLLALLAAVSIAGLAACGSSSEPTRKAKLERSASADAPDQAPIPPAGVIATREGRVDDEPVTLELTQLRRRGRLVHLELRLRTAAEEVELSVGGSFDDGVAQTVTDPAATLDYEFINSVDGISLIDGINGRRHVPARDRFGNCVCDRDITDVTISRRRPLSLSATFGAPPGDVAAVDVVIPRFGTIPDVPLA